MAVKSAGVLSYHGVKLGDTGAVIGQLSLPYHGVNQGGTESECTLASKSIFNGPSDQKAISAMLSWHITIMRVPMNEDCWLGINGEPANGTSALQYRQQIVNYVKLLLQNRLKVILDLHWSAPGSQQAKGQQPMPDADHAPFFWQSVASIFKNVGSVLFDLYNEPYTSSWSCWRNGSSGAHVSPCNDVGFAVAGMQTLVNIIRNTGARNVILLGGLAYSNNLSGWLQNKPNDPVNNLAASFHIYNFNACISISCLNTQVAPVRAQYPVLAEEIGENDCAHGFIDKIMSWFDMHNIGYLAWAWNTSSCSGTPALISNYDGTPTNFGVGLKNHLATLASSNDRPPPIGTPCTSLSARALPPCPGSNDRLSVPYHGVNHMGSEYRCIHAGTTTFDGPTDQNAISAMLNWHITIVRVPLNEDCWLGINGEPANGTSASQYQQDIIDYVKRLNQNGLKVIVELHWNAPGSQQAQKQQPMPDADHAPSFWQSVASTFKNDGSVLFDLYNEPYTSSWSCWRDGSSGAHASPCNDVDFAVAGMQTLVNTVRETGAKNVILLGGLAYSNNLSGWLQNKPNDPANNLAASFHIYNFNACDTISCLDTQVAPVNAQYPVLAEEIGENDCAHGFIDKIMPWFDKHRIGYLGWSWSTYSCSGTPALISNYDGTPTNFGIGLKNHLATLPDSGSGH